MALRHKGIAVDRIPMRFTDRACIAPSGQDRVPVLVDGDTWVSDSWAIACYLEETYPDRPSLFGGAVGRGEALFINRWVDTAVHDHLRALAVPDAYEHLHPDDRDWFRQSREAMFGQTIESMRAEFDTRLPAFHSVLEPVRLTVKSQAFLCGDEVAYADYILFGSFMWQRCASPRTILEPEDPVRAWRQRMLDLFDGYAASAVGYDN